MSSITPGILAAIVTAVFLVLACCICLCCCVGCCCSHGKSTRQSSSTVHCVERTNHRVSYPRPPEHATINIEDLESCDGELPIPTEPHSRQGYSFPLSVIPTDAIHRKRNIAPLPYNFHNFINNRIIPLFKDQRASSQYQFAVLVLLSEDDLADISNTSFTPSNHLDQPLVDKDYTSMPRQDSASCGNYIVARPSHNNWHSEEEIFSGGNSCSPFSRLWDAYVKCNGHYPKCILLYSWNLPCSRCTKVITRSLKDWPYNVTNVIVAHTTYWKWSESSDEHRENEDKLKKENINVKHVNNPTSISKAA